jgi:GNAT superfamily N-acetyltransferase
MTSVMTLRGSSAPHRRMAEVAVLRPATLLDTEAVLVMPARCSRETLLHRFPGFADAVDYFGALLHDGPVQQTLLAWYGSTGVGVATLGVDATGIVDLAALVEDARQRRGIGTHLTDALLDSARAHGVSSVHADVLGDDRFILKALRRIAPLMCRFRAGSGRLTSRSAFSHASRQATRFPSCPRLPPAVVAVLTRCRRAARSHERSSSRSLVDLHDRP